MHSIKNKEINKGPKQNGWIVWTVYRSLVYKLNKETIVCQWQKELSVILVTFIQGK